MPAVPLIGEAFARGGAEAVSRIRAAIALGAMGDPRALPALREMSLDPDPVVRNAASNAMRRIAPGVASP